MTLTQNDVILQLNVLSNHISNYTIIRWIWFLFITMSCDNISKTCFIYFVDPSKEVEYNNRWYTFGYKSTKYLVEKGFKLCISKSWAVWRLYWFRKQMEWYPINPASDMSSSANDNMSISTSVCKRFNIGCRI